MELTEDQRLETFSLMEEMDRFDAMDLSIRYFQRTGIRIDWHVFSDMLDGLYRSGDLRIVKPGGFITYTHRETSDV